MINYSCSFRTNLGSFRTFRCPLFPKPVTGHEQYFAVSYSKPALDLATKRLSSLLLLIFPTNLEYRTSTLYKSVLMYCSVPESQCDTNFDTIYCYFNQSKNSLNGLLIIQNICWRNKIFDF